MIQLLEIFLKITKQKTCCYSSETLLTSSIPNLELHSLTIKFNSPNFEVDPGKKIKNNHKSNKLNNSSFWEIPKH
jgi:hypothetical protein